jgi:hypothetical protein
MSMRNRRPSRDDAQAMVQSGSENRRRHATLRGAVSRSHGVEARLTGARGERPLTHGLPHSLCRQPAEP